MPQYVTNILCIVFAILVFTIWFVTLWINGYFGKKERKNKRLHKILLRIFGKLEKYDRHGLE